MKRWLSEPLLHFMLLGACIFLLYAAIGPQGPGTDEIVVTRGQQEHLVTAFDRTWQRPPTREEFQGLIDDWVRQEIAYREGLSMGLDTNDTIIRRRMRQKLELLAEDVAALDEPTETELQQWLDIHQDAYFQEPRYTLQQIFFSPDRRGDATEAEAREALAALDDPSTGPAPADLGDPLPLPARLVDERRDAIARQFGAEFADALGSLAPGVWQGPIRSGYGVHLVRIDERMPGRPLTLEEARDAVTRDLTHDQRRRAIDALYDRLRAGYAVTVEPRGEGAEGP